MARRVSKKTSTSRKPVSTPAPIQTLDGGLDNKKSSGGSFLKIFAAVILLLLILDGFNFFKNGFQFKKKFFSVKKIAQFTGTETTGRGFSTNAVVVVAPNELAVADNNANQILLYDFKGQLIRKWGKRGNGPMEFSEPSGITTDRKGHLFVLDTWNAAIKGFDLNGKLIQKIDLNHFQSFYGPRKIGWGGNCFLVADAANSRLVRLSLTGDLLSIWRGTGTGKGQFESVSSSITDGQGNFYICDGGKNSRIQVFNEDGDVVRIIKVGVPPDDLAMDSKGRIFVGSYGNPAKVFEKDGKYLGLLSDVDAPEQPIVGIQGIDIDQNGIIVTCGGDTITLYQMVDQKEK